MAGLPIHPRVRLSIELALTANNGSATLLAKQEEAGRALAMTGAEMDIARRGSSFDFNTSVAVSLALNACRDTRQRERGAGFSEETCEEIERIARSIRMPAA
ncbi:hypothetical protein ELG72_37525 [Rhizobium leguminosarum]|uniref:hypothetical protein n=1 Tax=Rhizobium TaxID=379 RepID=UPI001030C4FA|nr:hypothetical protein [Rhizobium leguminosarum]TBF87904.1 hypothetical protein ELG82_37575 [Rhizobium leguminosarum]TBG07115.1 hypothetical protein ELG80_37120 [Rhizobium leguminosarum]TBG07678.1 hypothetical protein ELG81_37420 [Rhizobium leguminosarum]TBG30799.1 hypothetical protein ELG75_36820 [Rhizobium leguminosarum]TBG50045.1 hypothetical protein ELG72_37525 [Rhizobium leguminosarum]